MNHNTANTSAVSTLSLTALAEKIRLLSGVITMVLGLLLFVIWFGHSMNTYLGRLAPRADYSASEGAGTALAGTPESLELTSGDR